MIIRRCVAYRNDLRETLTFDLKVKELNGLWSCTHILEYYSKNNYLILRSKSHEGHYGRRLKMAAELMAA
jgi:hypothetical protein